jgi:anti-anti-sigma regulatory factor
VPSQERWLDRADRGEPQGPLHITFTAPPATLRLDGVIDESTFGILTRTLTRARRSGDFPMLVDLAGVEFCDVAGLRAIISLVDGRDPCGRAAGEITLVHLPSHLATLLRVLGWDATPGLIVADPGS